MASGVAPLGELSREADRLLLVAEPPVRLVQAAEVRDLALDIFGPPADRQRLVEQRDGFVSVALVKAALPK